MTSEDRINAIVARLKERDQQAQEVLDKLRGFTDLLYSSLEKALNAIAQGGISQSANVKKNDLGNGFKSFTFDWDTFRVAIIPYLFAAYPAQKTELRIQQQPVGRITYFFQRKSDPSSGQPMGELYVYPNGQWYAFGAVGPLSERGVSEEKLFNFALSLLETFTHNFTSHHYILEDTQYDPTPQGVSSPIGFATPKPSQ